MAYLRWTTLLAGLLLIVVGTLLTLSVPKERREVERELMSSPEKALPPTSDLEQTEVRAESHTLEGLLPTLVGFLLILVAVALHLSRAHLGLQRAMEHKAPGPMEGD